MKDSIEKETARQILKEFESIKNVSVFTTHKTDTIVINRDSEGMFIKKLDLQDKIDLIKSRYNL